MSEGDKYIGLTRGQLDQVIKADKGPDDTSHHRWKGIHKLIEEMGEVAQVIGKINAFPDGEHPDGGPPLQQRIADELTDLDAAIQYFREKNGIMSDSVRYTDKLGKFRAWGLSGVI